MMNSYSRPPPDEDEPKMPRPPRFSKRLELKYPSSGYGGAGPNSAAWTWISEKCSGTFKSSAMMSRFGCVSVNFGYVLSDSIQRWTGSQLPTAPPSTWLRYFG
jgi:hypothetical protein